MRGDRQRSLPSRRSLEFGVCPPHATPVAEAVRHAGRPSRTDGPRTGPSRLPCADRESAPVSSAPVDDPSMTCVYRASYCANCCGHSQLVASKFCARSPHRTPCRIAGSGAARAPRGCCAAQLRARRALSPAAHRGRAWGPQGARLGNLDASVLARVGAGGGHKFSPCFCRWIQEVWF